MTKNTTHDIFRTIEADKEHRKSQKLLLKTQLPSYLMSLAGPNYSFMVRGYIPSFNDGDPCTFTTTEALFKFLDEKSEDDDTEYIDKYQMSNPHNKALSQIVTKELSGIDPNYFEIVYGEFFELIVTTDRVKQNDYDHCD